MAGSVNKVIIVPSDLYLSGLSIPQVSEATGVALSTLRFRFKKEGILRSRADGLQIASEQGRLGSGLRGKRRTFSKEHCNAISRAKLERGEACAAGVSKKPSGYLEYTRGENKGRCVHVVMMERRLGRALLDDECVHHIDGDRAHNEDNNLALVTRSGHARLHRREDAISGKNRERKSNGRCQR